MKICPLGTELLHAETHEEVMVAFRDFANLPKNIAKLSITQENNLGYKWKNLKTNQTGVKEAITSYHA